MALSAELGKSGLTPDSIQTTANVTVDRLEAGWTVTQTDMSRPKQPRDPVTAKLVPSRGRITLASTVCNHPSGVAGAIGGRHQGDAGPDPGRAIAQDRGARSRHCRSGAPLLPSDLGLLLLVRATLFTKHPAGKWAQMPCCPDFAATRRALAKANDFRIMAGQNRESGTEVAQRIFFEVEKRRLVGGYNAHNAPALQAVMRLVPEEGFEPPTKGL